MTIRRPTIQIETLPVEVHEKWVPVECHCDGYPEPHTNEYRLIDGDFLCVAALEEDQVIYKWRVDLVPNGKVANGYGHTMDEAKLAAEMTAKAMVTDRAAYYERHPEDRPPVQ